MVDERDGRDHRRAARRGAAREKLLAVAAERFYADGVAATGVDTITAAAGVAKMSLYNNFASKSELVEAYLERRHEAFLELHRQRVAALPVGADRTARVLAVFDAYLDHAGQHGTGFRGCGLLNAAAELPAGHPGRARVSEHKAEIESLLLDALTGGDGAGRADPDGTGDDLDTLAMHLSFLLEGATVRAGLDGDDRLLRQARARAVEVVDRG